MSTSTTTAADTPTGAIVAAARELAAAIAHESAQAGSDIDWHREIVRAADTARDTVDRAALKAAHAWYDAVDAALEALT